jgi:hypothetical protein
MDEKDSRSGVIPYPDITHFAPFGLIISEMWLDLTGMKPIGKVFIIHPELYQPVKDKTDNDQEY